MSDEIIDVDVLLRDCHVVAGDLEASLDRLKEFIQPFAALLPRQELRGHGEDFIRGLLSDVERKSTEPIAERAGKVRRPLQAFIGDSRWDHRPLLAELRRQVTVEIGTGNGILTLDGSAFPKKGNASVGVARQWCGRLGKMDNCQTGVFLGYVSNLGHTLVDERLYLPKDWALDRARREMCHVPKEVKFRTSHELCLEMLDEARGRLPHGWINGDDVFGSVSWFREALRERGERYLLDIPGSLTVRDAEGCVPVGGEGRPKKAPYVRAAHWKDTVPAIQWRRIQIRDGVKGPLVVWATRTRVQTRSNNKRSKAVEWLLVTRTESETPEYRYHLSNAGVDVTLSEMVLAVNARYWVEDCFARAKGRIGMDHYEVRSWSGWHHHMTLSLLALWFLVQEQRCINENTPAMTLQQSAEAVGILLRDPTVDARKVASMLTQRLRRTERVRIDHWRKFKRIPPRWSIARSTHVAQ